MTDDTEYTPTTSADDDVDHAAATVADEYGVLAEGAIAIQGDHALVVARFADTTSARAVYDDLLDGEIDGSLHIDGVLVVKADDDGRLHVEKMTDHSTRTGPQVGDRGRRRRRGLPAGHPGRRRRDARRRRCGRRQGAQPRPSARCREGPRRRHHAGHVRDPRPGDRGGCPGRRGQGAERRGGQDRLRRRGDRRGRQGSRGEAETTTPSASEPLPGAARPDHAESPGRSRSGLIDSVRRRRLVRSARRRQGATPSISMSSEKLRNVRTRTISPSVAAFSRVWSMATVRMMSAMIRISSPSRIVRPGCGAGPCRRPADRPHDTRT